MLRRIAPTAVFLAISGCQLVFDTDVLTSEPAQEAGSPPPIKEAGTGNDAAPQDAATTPETSVTPTGFEDLFERANGLQLGNGWVEKTDEAWQIENGFAIKLTAPNTYRDNVVYRRELSLDQEIAYDVRVNEAPPGSPSLHVRIQEGTVATKDQLDSYCLYVKDFPDYSPNTLILGRQRGSVAASTLDSLTFTDFQQGNVYRIALKVTGADPVLLDATISLVTGGNVQVLTQKHVEDTAPNRIVSPGFYGFSSDRASNRRFGIDRYVMTPK